MIEIEKPVLYVKNYQVLKTKNIYGEFTVIKFITKQGKVKLYDFTDFLLEKDNILETDDFFFIKESK